MKRPSRKSLGSASASPQPYGSRSGLRLALGSECLLDSAPEKRGSSRSRTAHPDPVEPTAARAACTLERSPAQRIDLTRITNDLPHPVPEISNVDHAERTRSIRGERNAPRLRARRNLLGERARLPIERAQGAKFYHHFVAASRYWRRGRMRCRMRASEEERGGGPPNHSHAHSAAPSILRRARSAVGGGGLNRRVAAASVPRGEQGVNLHANQLCHSSTWSSPGRGRALASAARASRSASISSCALRASARPRARAARISAAPAPTNRSTRPTTPEIASASRSGTLRAATQSGASHGRAPASRVLRARMQRRLRCRA